MKKILVDGRDVEISVDGTGESLLGHAFSFWKDGNDWRTFIPKLDSPETAMPFVVAFKNDGWWPRSCMVFGSSAEDAINRVMISLRYCAEHDYQEDSSFGHEEKRLLRDIESGELQLFVKPYSLEHIGGLN